MAKAAYILVGDAKCTGINVRSSKALRRACARVHHLSVPEVNRAVLKGSGAHPMCIAVKNVIP